MIALLASLLIPTADAANQPYMWGVGPSLSTIALPGEYPFGFPGDTNGKLSTTKNDLGIGAHGVLYLQGGQRAASHLTYGSGKNFNSLAFTVEYDQKLTGSNGVAFYTGVGGGFGNITFKAEDGDQELKTATFIARGNLGAWYRDGTRCYELSTFVQLVIPGNQQFTNAAGDTTEVSDGWTVLGGYSHLGIEGTVYFGDFTPPKKKKKKNKK